MFEECRALLQDQNGVFWVSSYGVVPALYYYETVSSPSGSGPRRKPSPMSTSCGSIETLCGGHGQGLSPLISRRGRCATLRAEQFGLSANGILALTADPQCHIWMGTSGGGVLPLRRQTFQSIRLGPSALENMVEAVLWRPSRSAVVWHAGGAGRLPAGTHAAVVSDLRGDGWYAPWPRPRAVSCPESTPEIRIHFQGISFRTGAGQMRYSHRLLGHDPTEQWSAFTAANAVAYNALPVGEYCFEVRTMDRDGLLSEVASVEIQILPRRQNRTHPRF